MARPKRKTAERNQRQVTRRPAAPAEPLKALTQEQLSVLRVMGITPAQIGIEAAPVLEGPEPIQLEGEPLMTVAEWLGKYESYWKSNKDNQGEEYRIRAGKVRWIIWKGKYKNA